MTLHNGTWFLVSFMLTVIYTHCHIFYLYTECHYADSAECHYAECRHAECHYADNAECHYADCRYAECRGAMTTQQASRNMSLW